MSNFYKNHLYNKSFLLFIFSFSIKVFFYLFVAKYYFGIQNFSIQGDAPSYIASIVNLIDNGTYTSDISNPNAFASRLPGYPFFMGIFFFILGTTNILWVSKVIVLAQIFISSISTVLIYKIVERLFNDKLYAFTCAILFAVYPFSLIWTPVLYAESIAIDILIWIYYLVVFDKRKYFIYIAGALGGLAVLFRPQLIFLWVSIPVYIFLQPNFSKKQAIQKSFFYLFFCVLIYSLWPIRNYVNHGQKIFHINLTSSRFMSIDRLNFAYFMWSVKTDWEPQISQIINNERVEMPVFVYEKLPPSDIDKLNLALKQSKTCSDGFANLKKLPKVSDDKDCTLETAKIWQELRKSIIKYAPVEYYFFVPLSNLSKALFKSGLIKSYNRKDKSHKIVLVSSLLFIGRSLLIFIGLGYCIFLFINYRRYTNAIPLYTSIIIAFFILYFWLCFIYRDMDMRYLLPADVLLIIPASYPISQTIKKCLSNNFNRI